MITGENIIGKDLSGKGSQKVFAIDPKLQSALPEKFAVATDEEIDLALAKAQKAFKIYSALSGKKRAEFLRAIADEIMALDNELLHRAMSESGLPEGRFKGERGRTVGQLRQFADLLEEGSWVEASIDKGNPDRTPAPKPDIRKMLVATGPIVVFTASNFPLAFSTAGGDTASALAAGCPVIVKAHESHMGTNELVAKAIQRAAESTGMPDGVFSSLNGIGYQLGKSLVTDARVKGVAFTGSHRGGLAIHQLAQDRQEPIPVFAEMGSINPMILLPEAVATNNNLPALLVGSVMSGVGQFCTSPGLLLTIKSPAVEAFIDAMQMEFSKTGQFTMLNESIHSNFENGKANALGQPGVNVECVVGGSESDWKARAALASTTGEAFLVNPELQKEVFGPFTLIVVCENADELNKVIAGLEGQLTGTIFSDSNEISNFSEIVETLTSRVGRVILNQVPTGVEVCHSMQHGGPFPAATDSRFTSVGMDAIKRFVRPIAFQNWPHELLPRELQDDNPDAIFRRVDGKHGKL